MTADRLLRWAIILSACDYQVRYQPTNLHGNAEGLLRLPISSTKEEGEEVAKEEMVLCAVEEEQLQCLPVQSKDIANAITNDPILSQVYDYTLIKGMAKIIRIYVKGAKTIL